MTTSDPPDSAFRKAAAAYQSAGRLRISPPVPQVVRLVEQSGQLAAPHAPAEAATSAPEPASAAAPAARPAAGVSLMITSAQKDSLRRLGVTEEEIRDMTPAEAHRRLGLTAR